MTPFGEATAAAALANLDEAIETIRASCRARTEGGGWALVMRAMTQAINARAKLADALALEEMADEMAVTTGEEAAE